MIHRNVSVTLSGDQITRFEELIESTESRDENELIHKSLAVLDRMLTGQQETPFINYGQEPT